MAMTVDSAIRDLVRYGISTGLLPKEEETYATNLLLDVLHLDATDDGTSDSIPCADLEQILGSLLEYAEEAGLIDGSITSRDLFDTRLMNCLVPRPKTVIDAFARAYEQSPQAATDYFYKLSQDSDYIRRYRVAKDKRWTVPTEYGDLDISINLSKPEKDPKAIAAAGKARSSAYPKCQLCIENEGYAGRLDHPARETHRIIPITINGTPWGFQYSPYTYYNEHCIALNSEHVPMQINHDAFVKLFDFVKIFPHYFIGSNADLPIVGGSILSHDHFQGGRYEFAMTKAPCEEEFTVPGYEDVHACIVKWPLSVIRLQSTDEKRLISLADHILAKWRGYTDKDAFIFAETDGEPHNTITPIARRRGDLFELDLVLRNNITTKERPFGVFHPSEALHHIKKENIGLIEVMGLAVLPARLDKELDALSSHIRNGTDYRLDELTQKHADWADGILARHPSLSAESAETVMRVLEEETGYVFQKVLEEAGVFKRTKEGRAAFQRFIGSL